MKVSTGRFSQQTLRSTIKSQLRSGYEVKPGSTVGNVLRSKKMSGVFYKPSVSKKEMMGAIKAVRTNRTIYKNLGKSVQYVVSKAKQEQKEQQRVEKVEIRKGQQRQDRMIKEMFGWRKQGEEKQGLSLTDLRKKSAGASQGTATGKSAAGKPVGANAKFAPRSRAALSTLPRLYRSSSVERPETHQVNLEELQKEAVASSTKEEKAPAEKPEPTESKSESTSNPDDMMLD
ncbi:MAG: hypothetical protein WC497_05820 [Patescibacteria group bacterium]